MSNMNYLIENLIYLLSDARITFSHGDATKIKLSSSQGLAPGLSVNSDSVIMKFGILQGFKFISDKKLTLDIIMMSSVVYIERDLSQYFGFYFGFR